MDRAFPLERHRAKTLLGEWSPDLPTSFDTNAAVIRYTYPENMPDIPAELEAVAGPLKGSSISLLEDEVSFGREPSNIVSLLDAAVSRRHCVITYNSGQFKIQDLNSRNSTFVNGVPVTERTLASGDEIKIGNSLFIFVLPETEKAKGLSTSVEFDKADEAGAGSTIILRKQDARYLRDLEGIPLESAKATSRTVRDLNALLRISKAVNSVRGPGSARKTSARFDLRGGARGSCRHPAVRAWPGGMDLGVRTGIAGAGRIKPCKSAGPSSRRCFPMAWRCSPTIFRLRNLLRHREHYRAAHPRRTGRAAGSLRPDPGSHLSGRLQSGGPLRRESPATVDRDRQHRRGGARQCAPHGIARAGESPSPGRDQPWSTTWWATARACATSISSSRAWLPETSRC